MCVWIIADCVPCDLLNYGSKSVVKYPRCNIRRQSTYADAEEDLSIVFTLASTWAQFFAFGSSACGWPMFYTINLAYQNATNLGLSYGSHASELKPLFMAIGFIIGYPVVSASVKVLHGLWRNDLAALKGSCPNCGEEVFAFVKMDKTNYSPHRAKCHVCECLLEFCTEVEQSTSRFGRQWVYERSNVSIGKQWKEFLDYNETIGFIFHDDAKKLDRAAKNKYVV
ncbi:hypothetical protein P8452_20128 [Trifolium repens]|nr:PGR5 protein 1B, chloroplastic [Trifolium repens]WJX31726.1 hypothetical protein P8452_20128 [Trifolium repens]